MLVRAQQAIWNLDGSGIGILEHSHRGKEFGRVLDRTESAVREVGKIGDDYAILFVTGGATQHFAMVPQNFLGAGETAEINYFLTEGGTPMVFRPPMTVNLVDSDGGQHYRSFEDSRIYADPGTAVSFAPIRSSSVGFAGAAMAISGHLIDLP